MTASPEPPGPDTIDPGGGIDPSAGSTGSHWTGPTVTICRGCCCGTIRKHPDVDHDQQVRELRAAVGEQAVRVATECLGQCERSNVMVVLPSRLGRLFGGRPTWLGRVLDEEHTSALAQWLTSAGPGLAPLPADLQAAAFRPVLP